MTTNKGRGRSRKGNLVRRLMDKASRVIAYLLCVSMVVISLPGSLILAGAETDEIMEEEETYAEIYSMTIDLLCDALEDAVRNGEPVEDDFEFSGSNADKYQKLFDTEDELLYEIYPDLDEEGDSITLRTFARLEKSDIEAVSSEDDEEAEGDTEENSDAIQDLLANYNVTGNEQIIFLLVNNTDDKVSARIHVTTSDEIYETKEIIVPGNGSDINITLDTWESIEENDAGITIDTLESMDTMEYIVIDDIEENVETAALKVETASDADQAPVSSDGSASASVSVVATEKVESASNAASSKSSGAYTDGCTAMSGTLYDPTTINDQPAVAFATTLKKLGVDYGIKLLTAATASDADTFKEAIQSAREGDTVTLTADITVDCTGGAYVTVNVKRITVDLGEKTITVESSSNYPVFDVASGGKFTIENGTIDGKNSSSTAVDSETSGNDITLDSLTIQNFANASNGAVYAKAGNLTVTNCMIQDNGTHGIHADGCNDITITGCTISGNSASGDGGGIYIFNHHSKIIIQNNTVNGNKASSGGGIYIFESTDGASSGEFAVTGNKINNNEAYVYDGGGIYFETSQHASAGENVGDFDLSGNTITKNTANANGGYGGGIELRVDVENREIVIKSGYIAENTAYWGGGIDSSFSSYRSGLHLYNAVITQNTAKARGGGIWACPTSETIMNVTFGAAIYGNTASGRQSAWTYGLSGDEIRFEGKDTDAANLQDASGYAYVSERALGGTLMDWYADDDTRGTRYQEGNDPVDVTSERYTGVVDSFGLHGELNDDGIELAKDNALLYIVDNISETVGGGIAVNTPIDFGSDGKSLKVTANKIWIDNEGKVMTTEQTADYSVDITIVRVDEDRNKETDLETVTLNSENKWTHDFEDLPTAYMTADYNKETGGYTYSEHKYTYTVKEENVVTDANFAVKVESSDVTENENGNLEQTLTVTNTYREYYDLDEEIIPGMDDADNRESWEKNESVNEYGALEFEMSTFLPKAVPADVANGDWTMLFHNKLDAGLKIDANEESDLHITIGGQPVPADYYTVEVLKKEDEWTIAPLALVDGKDDCSFHVTVELSRLYNETDIVNDKDLTGETEIIIYFYVDLEGQSMDGSYKSVVQYQIFDDEELLHTSNESTVYVYTYEIGISKSSSADNSPLAGATFGVYYDEACTQPVTRYGANYTVTSGEDGKVLFWGLAAGTYYLKELEAPEGFVLTQDVYKVVVGEEQVNISGSTNMGTDNLDGALFGVYYDEECTQQVSVDGVHYTVTSDSEGNITFDGIAAGKYYLKLVDSEGHQLGNEVIPVKLDYDTFTYGYDLTVSNPPSSTKTNNVGSNSGGGGYSGSGSSHSNSSTSGPGAENTAHESSGGGDSSGNSIGTDSVGVLPQTGEGNTAAILMGLCAVFVVLLAGLFYLRRKTPNENE